MADDTGYADLSQVERKKREEAWRQKKLKLANPNFLVSDVRLSVRNLPPAVDDERLRELATNAAQAAHESAGPPTIRQVKIVRDEAVRATKHPHACVPRAGVTTIPHIIVHVGIITPSAVVVSALAASRCSRDASLPRLRLRRVHHT